MQFMWEELEIERVLETALIGEFGNTAGKAHFANYVAARAKLPDVWEEIKRREPDLTDHGPRHIADVLRQVHQITPQDHLNARELFVLLLSVLFHDSGNIHGRAGHEKKISDIYDFVVGTPTPPARLQEKRIVLAIVGAHGGEARDGSKDTLRDLNITEPLLKQSIRMREIASILRFADELAEGPHRTSEYLRRVHAFDKSVEVFHDYASITEICIDPGNNRIALTYHIDIRLDNGSVHEEELARIERLLTFAYHRIRKVDEERQYARYYSSALGAFKRTSATIHIWMNGQQLELGLEPLELTDLVVPEGTTKSIPDIDSAYRVATVIQKLKASCPESAVQPKQVGGQGRLQ